MKNPIATHSIAFRPKMLQKPECDVLELFVTYKYAYSENLP
jgi:hypothetical protein